LTKYFDFLEWIEETQICAGMCGDPVFYAFSDINYGKPEENCLSALEDFMYYLLDFIVFLNIIIGSL